MDLKAPNSNNNKNSIDNEKSAFERFESELKNTIFGVLFVLLKDEEMSIWVTFILSLIEFFQILIFPFHSQINVIWNSKTLAEGIERFLEFFQIVYYFKSTNWDVYIIIFYVGIGIIGLVILDIFYVSYSFSKKKFAFVWPLHALRSVCGLFVTILFLPFLDFFISVLGCIDNGQGKNVHHFFTEIECWQGIYILHAVLSIIVSVVFIIISLVVSITYFECRSTSNDPGARVNARANFLFNFYEMVMIISFTFMNGDQYQYILLALILAGSTILFMKFHFNSPYYNEIIAKLWSALMSINLWTAMMLVFSKIMENTLFEGSIIAWMIGIPFIVLIVITNRDHRIDLLLINVNKFQNGQEIQNQIRYILKLISWQATNRNAAILLDGYIEIHKQTCNKDDCPLKQKVVKNNRLTKSLLNNDESLNEKYALLIQLLYKMYFYGIKKFPNNTSLRISYAFFLLEKMHSKQQALQELSQAEQNKPPFDEQFIIYRYKKIIEDEIAESQNEGTGGLDVVSEIAFQNHLRQCQANIEKSALLHMEFWSQLSEDNPDLAKLNDIGSKINTSVAHVEEHWNKLLKINTNMPKAMRMYGKFLIEIINDKEAGEDLLDRARNMMNINTNKKAVNLMNAAGNDDFSNEATPTVFISGEQDKFGIITGINLAAASLFGYNKTELINRKVNVLMPQVYSKYHDSFIENYLNNNEAKLANTNKEKFVFGKNKSNYIFPVYINIKAVPSILQGIQFNATFRVEKNFKNAAYVLTYPDGTIDSVSSSSINLLKLDLKMVMQKKSVITDFVPNIMKERSSLFASTAANSKAYAQVNFNYPKDSEYTAETGETSAPLNCYLFDVVFLSGRENAGLQFRFEKIADNKNTSFIAGDRRAKISNFQFRYEKNKPHIIGEYVDGSTSDLAPSQIEPSEYNDDMMNSAMRSNLGDNDMGASAFGDGDISARKPITPTRIAQVQLEPQVKKIEYGAGIKTLRLINGKAGEIEDFKNSEEEEGDENNPENANLTSRQSQGNGKKPEEDGDAEISFKEFNTTFKSRKALNMVINDRRPPSSIRNLKWTANFLVIVLCVIAAVDYFITAKEFKNIQDNLNLINLSNQRVAEFQNIVSKMRDLCLLNMGFVPPVTTTLTNATILQNSIEASTTLIKSIQDQLSGDTSGLSSRHSALLTTASTRMKLKNGASSPFNLNEAVSQAISRALTIATKKPAEWNTIVPEEENVYFVTYNSFNDFYNNLRLSSELYVEELKDNSGTKKTTFMVILIVSAIALIVSMLVLFPVLFKVNKTREEVLSLFLDIPEKTVKGLYTKCENFISNLQVGEDDDMVSELEDESFEKNNEDSDLQEYNPRKRRKKFKNSGKSQRKFFIKFFLAACCIEAYFIATFFLSKDLLDDVNAIIKEVNSTSVAESFYSFVNNVERQLMMDPTYLITNKSAQNVSVENIKAMYYLDSEIHQEHSVNIKIHSEEYKSYFNHIMMLSPCDLIVDANIGVDNATCSAFADGAVFQGMAVALTRHFENLRYLLILYVQYNNNNSTTTALNWTTTTTTPSGSPPNKYYTNGGTNGLNNITGQSADQLKIRDEYLSIMTLPQAIEIDTTQHVYIKTTFRILMQKFKEGMDAKFDKQLTNMLIIFIFFYILFAFAYIFFWVQLVNRLNKDIWRTKSMLTMIPLNVVAKIRNVRVFLKKFWNERTIANY